MTKENEAHRDWRLQPCENPTEWWTVGYIYEGNHGKHQGEFVPVFHFASETDAEEFRLALLEGCSRDQAKARVIAL